MATRALQHSPMTERSLAILAVGAAIGFSYVIRDLLVPSVVALVLAFTVHPLVARLEERRVPHVLAAVAGTAMATGIVVLVSLQGNVVDPIFPGKQLRLSALVVFVGSLFFYWLWGPVGLFVAVPVLSTIRIACKYVPRLSAIADFLAA